MHPASATARFGLARRSRQASSAAKAARSYGGQVAGIALTAGAVLSATQAATFRAVLER